jgi:hypothetical protein
MPQCGLALVVLVVVGAAACAHAQPQWTSLRPLAGRRKGHTATLLADGRVLVAGGVYGGFGGPGELATVEIYDPGTGNWTSTGSLQVARQLHTATLLEDGRVLVAGGVDGSYLDSCELYDPSTGTWASTGALGNARQEHTAVRLLDGRVLVVGGEGRRTTFLTAELYDASTGRWRPTQFNLTTPHATGHVSVRLASGLVLVTGGFPGPQATAEVFDPATEMWTPTGTMSEARHYPTATLLPGTGNVLVAGGFNAPVYLRSAELYDPSTGQWTATGNLEDARYVHTATLLLDGTVLATGGWSYFAERIRTSEVYNATTGTWVRNALMADARTEHQAVRLQSGDVLVVGGDGVPEGGDGDPEAFLNSTELYQCLPGLFGPTCTPCNCCRGGVCAEGLAGNGSCMCLPGYAGVACEQLRCDVVGCHDHGTCRDDGACACALGWGGDFCADALACPAEPCQHGGGCLQDTTCACRFGYTGAFCEELAVLAQLTPVLVLAGTLLGAGILYAYGAWAYPEADNDVIFVVMLGLLDVGTDLMFAASIYNNPVQASLFWWAVAFVTAPLAVNLALGVWFLTRVTAASGKTAHLHDNDGDGDAQRHAERHHGTVALVALLSMADVEALGLLASGLFGWDVFSAKWPAWAPTLLVYLGLAPIFVEDLPQMALQALVLSETFNVAAIVALAVSGLSIVHAVLARVVLRLARRRGRAGHTGDHSTAINDADDSNSGRAGGYRALLDADAKEGPRPVPADSKGSVRV